MLTNIKNEKLEIENEIECQLTTSFIPGTTLKIIPIKIPGLKLKLYDTPGILDSENIYSLVDSNHLLKEICFEKHSKFLKLILKPKKSLWIGSLVKLDLLSVV